MLVTTQTWIDAQQAVLGSCLIDGRCSSYIVFGLDEDDFIESYRALYVAIRDLYTTGKPVDPVTVVSVVGSEYRKLVVELMEITPTAANIKHYVEICKSQSLVIRLREIGARLAAVDSAEEGRELAKLAQGMNVKTDSDTWTLAQGFSDFFSRYQSKPDYLDWFVPQLRKVLRAASGHFYLLGARPGVGKSAFAIQAVLFWAVFCGKRVCFFTHESSREEVIDRMVAAAVHVPLERIKERTLDEKELEKVCTMAAKINAAPLDICLAAKLSVQDIEDRVMKNRYEIIVVDYLQIVRDSGKTEYERVTNISQALRILCTSHKIFTFALCQLDRLKGAEPTLEDLRSSGQLEQDADAVLLLHKLANEPDEPRKLIIAKNRHGKCFPTKLAFDGDCQQFAYLGKGTTPQKPIDYSDTLPQSVKDRMENFQLITEPDEQLPFAD